MYISPGAQSVATRAVSSNHSSATVNAQRVIRLTPMSDNWFEKAMKHMGRWTSLCDITDIELINSS